jgi:hypothetical protein
MHLRKSGTVTQAEANSLTSKRIASNALHGAMRCILHALWPIPTDAMTMGNSGKAGKAPTQKSMTLAHLMVMRFAHVQENSTDLASLARKMAGKLDQHTELSACAQQHDAVLCHSMPFLPQQPKKQQQPSLQLQGLGVCCEVERSCAPYCTLCWHACCPDPTPSAMTLAFPLPMSSVHVVTIAEPLGFTNFGENTQGSSAIFRYSSHKHLTELVQYLAMLRYVLVQMTTVLQESHIVIRVDVQATQMLPMSPHGC